MAWCLTAPSHYLNQCWFFTSTILCHSAKGTGNTHKSNHHNAFDLKLKPYPLHPGLYRTIRVTDLQRNRGDLGRMTGYQDSSPNNGHQATYPIKKNNVDGLVQERRNSSTLAVELRLSCTNPPMSTLNYKQFSAVRFSQMNRWWIWIIFIYVDFLTASGAERVLMHWSVDSVPHPNWLCTWDVKQSDAMTSSCLLCLPPLLNIFPQSQSDASLTLILRNGWLVGWRYGPQMVALTFWGPGPLLLTWIDFNSSMVK